MDTNITELELIQAVMNTTKSKKMFIRYQAVYLHLQGYQNIVAIYDPCGQQGLYNEVFLKLSSGHYLASFSDNTSGTNTRFVVLTDGSFATTDGTHCYFTMSNNGTIISNEHN